MTPKRKQPDLKTYSGRVAARLIALREKAGLSVEEIAKALGISPRAVYHWESGRSEPKLAYFPELAKLLGVKNPRYLLPEK